MRTKNISGFKVNKVRCSSCPFNEYGDRETRHAVEARCFKASQMCHGTNDTTLCRGSRDHQLQIFHRMGWLKEPTDECWDKLQKEIKREQERSLRFAPQSIPQSQIDRR